MLEIMQLICSRPGDVARRCRQGHALEDLARTSLLLTFGGTAAFGFVLGMSRDVQQAMASALKLPLVWVITLALCAPAFYAVAAVCGQGMRFRGMVTLLLAATARASLVLFALLPMLWLVCDLFAGSSTLYHKTTMFAAGIYACSGVAALGIVVRAFAQGAHRLPLFGAFVAIFFLVAGQTAWSLRPFVGRPSQDDVPWVRTPEDTFLSATRTGWNSARGIYRAKASVDEATGPRGEGRR